MGKPSRVLVLHGALDETAKGDVILRGALCPTTLQNLRSAPYQREQLPASSMASIAEGFKTGSIPDVVLGMRGEDFSDDKGIYTLKDAVYIIDGLQRVSVAIDLASKDTVPSLGAMVYFGTTESWEREHFRLLNVSRTKLSPNVILRNAREDNSAIDALYRLGRDKGFVLHDRVSWGQRMLRSKGEMLTASSLVRVVGQLHSHAGPGQASSALDLMPGLLTIQSEVGAQIFRDNVRTFFEVVDACWGVRKVAYSDKAPYLNANFLVTLARVLSNHLDFWRGGRLMVEKPLVRKIGQFPIYDPGVLPLTGAAGKSRDILYILLVDHINSGKRTRRLTPRMRDQALDTSLSNISMADEE